MERIHRYVVGICHKQTEMREEAAKQARPIAGKEDSWIDVLERMSYGLVGQHAPRRFQVRETRATELVESRSREHMDAIRSFLIRPTWTQASEGANGISWLELSVWFPMHSGKDAAPFSGRPVGGGNDQPPARTRIPRFFLSPPSLTMLFMLPLCLASFP